MDAHESSIDFRFKWLDDRGVETGILRKPGRLEPEFIVLQDSRIPLESVIEIAVRDHHIALMMESESGDFPSVGIAIFGIDPLLIQRAVHQRTLLPAVVPTNPSETEKLGDGYCETCPHCCGVIDLNGLPRTPQVYCEQCDTLFTVGQLMQHERECRICESCGMYSRPRQFTIFYFYFLGLIYGVWHDKKVYCAGCMRGDAWKMAFGNLFGLIGLPVAAVQLYRAYSGKRDPGPLRGLDDANLLARRGKVHQALQLYDQLLDFTPINAGLKYNIARGLSLKQDYAFSQQMYEMALDDCANYWPAVDGLISCLEEQGLAEQADSVRAIWYSVTLRTKSDTAQQTPKSEYAAPRQTAAD